MEGHLAAVAVGSAQTEISASIRLMGRFFEQGVPTDDDTCARMMRALPCASVGSMEVDLSADFKVALSFLCAGVAKDLDEDRGVDYPLCDVYGQDEEALEAEFYYVQGTTRREVGMIRARATPNGFRQFIRDVRSAARALRDSGLCPSCPDRATASMRLPHASYCGECCIAVAILGDKR